MAIKIAFIGAGSLTFTRDLFRDILTVPELRDTQFAFMDINKRYLDMTAELCRKDIRASKLPATILATTDRRKALEGARYVVSCVRIGGLEAFKSDIDIPLKYGVDQCVGDTLCAGGIMYGQRNIAFMMDLCRDIREVAGEDVLLLNYANPNAMNTWAAIHHGGVNALGLCHGVMAGHREVAEVVQLLVNGRKKPGGRGYVSVTTRDVDIVCAGINHQTWYIQVQYKGEDWTGRLLEGFEKHPVYSRTEKVRIDLLRRFGYYTTESNGHCSEYVPWYRKRPADIPAWIDLSSWICGETGGYLRMCIVGRDRFQKVYRDTLKEAAAPLSPEKRGHEHGSYIIEALETGRLYRGHFNVVNHGCIPNLPENAIVEVPGYVDHNGVNIPRVGALPLGCAAVCNAAITVQRLAVEAGVRGDPDVLKQAMMMDPLTGAVCDPEEISQMTDEMLVAQARWLPQYGSAISAARGRQSKAKRRGVYRGTQTSRGAARLPVRTTLKAASEWATKGEAKILQRFRATALQAGEDIHRAKPSPKLRFEVPLRAVMSDGTAGFVDVRHIHANKEGVLFLASTFEADKARGGSLLYGADGPVKVWVNGRLVGRQLDATNPSVAGQYRTKVRWTKGSNEIVFALSSNSGNAWGIFVAAG